MAHQLPRGSVILIPEEVTATLPTLPFQKIVRYNGETGEVDPKALAEDPELLSRVDMLVTFKHPVKALHGLLAKLPNIRFVQCLFAGVDNVTSFPLPPGTVVSNCTEHDAPTAELGVAFALNYVRNILGHAKDMATKRWDTAAYLASLDPTRLNTVEGKAILMVGMGAIGTRMARVFDALGAKIFGAATSTKQVEGFDVYGPEDLQKLAGYTDIIVSAIPGIPANVDYFGDKFFDMLRAAPKRERLFINISRGNVVDEAALIRALDDGTLSYACLDVTKIEPLPQDSPLWGHPKVLITPHVGGARSAFMAKALQLVARNAQRYVDGDMKGLENVIDPKKGYLGLKPKAAVDSTPA